MMSTLSSTVYAWGGGTGTGSSSTGTAPNTTPYTGYTGTTPTSGNTSAGTIGTTVSQQTGPTGSGDPDEPTSPGEDDPGSGGGPGPGGGGNISVTNITNNYYYLDVGLQFKPRVGVVLSINNSADVVGMGSARKSLTEDNPVSIPGTVWSPQLEDIPDVPANIGREFSYGVLYSGYWDTPLTGTANDMKIINYEAGSGDYDSTGASVERSWANRDPGAVLSDDVGPESGGKEEFYSEYEKKIYEPIAEAPTDWNWPHNWDVSLGTKTPEGDPGPLTPGGNDVLTRTTLLTPYVSKVWYTEQETAKTSQNSEFIQHYITPLNTSMGINEDIQRALNILGYDILFRDEWVTSVIYQDGGESYFGYGYSNTNVLDTNEVLGDNLLTSDYVLQSIYRALGVNCLRTETYFYADKDLTVDFTPLAEKITVAMDKINQIQNRADVFVTRANLEDYWNKAVEDGIVYNYGVTVLNDIDGAYKPHATELGSDYVDKDTGLTYTAGTWVQLNSSSTTDYTKIDYNRTKTMTLAEFCVYVKKLMDIYGEEILTDKEMEILLVTYGTKLPYNLEDQEQFEAIKYLMAKGIVSDDMYWEGSLTLEDMLVILSRVKDEGSRLTFKEIEIEYDPDLVSKGYCPAEMSFVEETSIGVVSTTLNESYNYSNAEWFDYFLRMPDTVKSADGKKEVNPRFIRTDGAQEYVTTDLFITQRGLKDDKKNNDKEDLSEDEKYTYVLSDTSQEGKDGIEVLGYENLNDGYEYLHIRVKTSLLFKDGSPDEEYVNPNNDCIYINTKDSTDAPTCWKVDYRGGVFRNPVLRGGMIKWESGTHYTDKGTKYTVSTSTVDLSSYKIKLEDFDELSEHKTCKSLVMSLNIDGTVKDAYTYTSTKGKDDTMKYMTFDQAGWGYKYCDYDRYVNHLAISFARNPMLSDNDTVGEVLAEALPQYDIWFYVLCDSSYKDRLSSDLYIGDAKLVDRNKPKEILVPDAKIEYLAYAEGKYYYVARGQNTEQNLSDSLRTSGGNNINASYCNGYIKQNNTVLVSSEDLIKIVEITSDFYTNGSITKINDDTLCISFDVKGSDYMDQITHTIYLCESMKLLSVNNMVYQIPNDEVLFVDNTASGGGYLLNYRAVMGWGSGYVNANTDIHGKVELALSTSKKDSDFKLDVPEFSIANAYTLAESPAMLIYYNGKPFSIPASTPNNTASWLIYQSQNMGTWAIVLKNNDSKAEDSVVSRLTENDDVVTRYDNGNDWLDKMFGVKVSSEKWRNSDVLVDVYNLGNMDTGSAYVIDYDKLKGSPESVSGKFYYDPNLCTWAYVPYCFSDADAPLYMSELRFGPLGVITSEKGTGQYAYGLKTSEEYVSELKVYCSKLQDAHELYYKGEMILPYFTLGKASSSDWIFDISCNIHEGAPYGAVPLWTISYKFEGSNNFTYELPPLDMGNMSECILGVFGLSSLGSLYYPTGDCDLSGKTSEEKETSIKQMFIDSLLIGTNSGVANTTPAPIVPVVMGISTYELNKENFPSKLRINWGNYRLLYDSGNNKITYISDVDDNTAQSYMGTAISPEGKSVYLIGVTMTRQIGFLSSSDTVYFTTDNRNILVDKTTKASLQELDQIGGVNWGAYTFDNLIHDVDNGLSILLIIVLNIIPRIGMFIFVILIGLSTVANMKPVRKFCDSIFDPYKLITLGHCTVYTINTKLLLISSIIGLAAFGLFMDGTLINLLTWLVQFVSAFVTR